jgi:hypothetical protein
MTTRTVKMYGLAYGETVDVNITFDGVTVYSGTVPSTNTPVPTLPNILLVNTTEEFCNFEIPMEFEGTKPMTCSVTSGVMVFAQITANYGVIYSDPIYSEGANVFLPIGRRSDARSNVFIDGVAQPVNRDEIFNGTWWFTVAEGSTLTYDLNIAAGTANVAPLTETPE